MEPAIVHLAEEAAALSAGLVKEALPARIVRGGLPVSVDPGLVEALEPVGAVEQVAPVVAAVAARSTRPMEDEMKKVMNTHTVSRRLVMVFWLAVLAAALTPITIRQLAAQSSQKTFDSPTKAAAALLTAVKSGDTNELMMIFGPRGKELLSSGDPVADKNNRSQFIQKYEEMNRLATEPDKSVTLYIGAENWPFPIPLVQKNGAWLFDTAKGKKEVLFRRIGRNEDFTTDTLESLVEAQKEYASQTHDQDNMKQYAQKVLSDDGKHNGLYWKAAKGEPQSPIGPLIAEAAKQGYAKQAGPTPFHGYLYRVLLSQGKDAPGGAMDYMTNGKLTRGFALVAYPAEYRNSGVMTFIVNQSGQVYQKDLGSNTANIAASMKDYNPDKSWQPAE
jgi:hypothetical protein